MAKTPSPCVDVCKYKLRGHCIACAMTKLQKRAFDALDGDASRRAFIAGLIAQQKALGDRFRGWETAYRRKCARKGAACLLDDDAPADRTGADETTADRTAAQ